MVAVELQAVTNRGSVVLKRWEENLIAEREAVQVSVRCAWCGKAVSGDLALARDWHEAHRLWRHPEVRPRPRRQRKRPGGQISTGRNIDDNIAAARKTGAAGWAGPT